MKKQIVLLTATLTVIAGVANADDYYWGGGTGNWTDANWSGSAVSDWSGHKAHIDSAGSVSITSAVSGTPSQIRMGAGGGDVSLMVGADITGGSFVIGDNGSGDATVTMTNGTVNMSGYNYVGYKGTGTYSLNLSNGTLTITGAKDYIGCHTDGTLNIMGGTYDTRATSYCAAGYDSSSVGTINVDGGTLRAETPNFSLAWTLGNTAYLNLNGGALNSVASGPGTYFLVGRRGLGIATMNAGSLDVGASQFTLSYDPNSEGQFVMNDGTITHTASGSSTFFIIGRKGSGNFTMNGGQVETSADNFSLCYYDTASGSLELNGGTISQTASNTNSVFCGGRDADATISIYGGTLETAAQKVGIGYYTGTTVDLTITNGLFSGTSTNEGSYFAIGRTGNATLNMTGGTIRSSAEKFAVSYYASTSTVNFVEGLMQFTGKYMYVGREGVATFNQSGGILDTTGFILADLENSSGKYSISGGSFSASKYIFGHTAGAEFVVAGSGATNIEAGAVLFPAGTLTFQVDSNGCSRLDAVGGYHDRGIELDGATVRIEPLPSFDPNDVDPGGTLDLMWSANGFITEGMTFVNETGLNLTWDIVPKDGGEVFRLIVLKDTETVSPPVRVMSYNMYHGETTNGVIDLDLTASVIGSANPDLVALQEVDKETTRSGGINQAAYIAGQLGMNYRFGKAKDFQNGEFGVAILSRFPIVSDTLYDLPDGSASNSEHRVALEVQVDAPDIYGNTTTVSFVSTHLDQLSDDARTGQVNAIVNDLSGRTHPVILCGDLNATAESNSVQTLVASGYLYQDRQLKNTFPATNAYKKIDFITVRTNDASMASVPVFVGDNAAASDHLFICTDIHLGAPAAWLASYGLAWDGLQGFVDSDEDGIDDYREWWYGTNPTDADETFAITGGGRVDATSKVKLVWMSAPQDTFRIERSTDLIYKSFEAITNGLPASAVSNRTEFIDNDSVTNQEAFYRVILED